MTWGTPIFLRAGKPHDEPWDVSWGKINLGNLRDLGGRKAKGEHRPKGENNEEKGDVFRRIYHGISGLFDHQHWGLR